MSRRIVQIHPAALEEVTAARDWYAERSVRAAERFLDELDHAIERISENPDQFPEYVFGTRRAVFRRFPYIISFRVTDAVIEVVAVAHGRRRPGYWRDRV